ncbi:MAG: response regulator transcription factor [Bacteroidota bacterium]|nr:response regulator transcription factor [Bacteroidota bacterium]
MIKVLLVDDHKIVRDGITALLKSEKTIKLVGECTDGSEVMGFLASNKVDVILMDIMMPNINGIEAGKMVMEKYTDMRILTLSMNNDFDYIQEMLEISAAGYILKNTGGAELIKAIKTVAEGKPYFSPEVTDIVMNKHMNKQKTKKTTRKNSELLEQLTNREVEILKLIAQELTNIEIGEQLFISHRTVDTHRRNLLQKLGAKNSIGLIRFAYSTGLITD